MPSSEKNTNASVPETKNSPSSEDQDSVVRPARSRRRLTQAAKEDSSEEDFKMSDLEGLVDDESMMDSPPPKNEKRRHTIAGKEPASNK